MIFSRSLLTFIAFFSFFLVTTGSATAGYGQESTRFNKGGGSWGAILEMSADVRGPFIVFTIRKKDGLSFNTESTISIRAGSYNGQVLASGIIPLGSSSVNLKVRPDNRNPEQSYYAYLFNSYGHAWVGPLQLVASANVYPDQLVLSDGRDETGYYPVENNRLERPRIDNHPKTAFVNEEVRIAVTAGYCRDSKRMRLQCYSEDYNQQQSNQYNSWIQPYGTVQVPFVFNTIGPATLFCKVEDRCGDSAWARRSINVKEREQRRMKNSSSQTKINISVVTDADGTTDSKVSVESNKNESCAPFCKGSGEITYDKPYLPEGEYQEYIPVYSIEPRDGDYVLPESVPDL